MTPRRRLSTQVAEPYRLDRRDLARRLDAAVDWERVSYRVVSLLTGVPTRQLSQVANARPVMDWAYHAIVAWIVEVEARMRRHLTSKNARELTRFEREQAARFAERVGRRA